MRFHARHLAILAVLGSLIVLGCRGDDDRDATQTVGPYGPMAVIAAPELPPGAARGYPEARGGSGPLEIGDRCVTVRVAPDLVILPVWHEELVAWDAEARTIVTSGPNRVGKPLRDGVVVTLGGRGLLPDESVAMLSWVAPPDPSCRWDRAFLTSSLGPPS